MSRDDLEPGLLQVFRWAVAARSLLLLLAVARRTFRLDPRALRYPLLSLAEALGLLLLLSWPWIRKQLGSAFLPLALALASFGPILVQGLTVALRLLRGADGLQATRDAWTLIVVLFIPLIMTAWQYGAAGVLIFASATTLLDLVITVTIAVVGRFRPTSAISLIGVRLLLFGLVGYLVARLMAGQRARREALEAANDRLATYAATLEQLAVSRERNRLARELHDTLAHSLSAVAVQLEAVRSLWESDPEGARRMVDRSLGLTREGLGEARRAIDALRASPLEDLGLSLALRRMVESAAERAGLTLTFDLPAHARELTALSPAEEQALYRIAHEVVENIVQHAQATCVSLALVPTPDALTMTIVDNGVGFDTSQPAPEGRYGLRGIQERAELIDARATVESRPGLGTTVTVAIPRGPSR